MSRRLIAVLLLALAGCASLPPPPPREPSSCELEGEASYACQVQRYHDVDAD